MRLNPESLARASSRHPWRTIAVWFVILATGFALSTTLLGRALTTDMNFTNEPEAKRAQELIEERLTGPEKITELFIVSSSRYTVGDPQFEAYVDGLQADVLALGDEAVEAAVSYFQTQDPTMVSQDGRTVLMPVTMAGTIDDASEHVEDLQDVIERDVDPAFRILVFGDATLTEDFKEISEEDLRKGESVGIVVALIVLVVVFGAVVAGVVPIVLGIFAIGLALGLIGIIGLVFDFSFFVTNMVSMMGLAVGIDYSLFIVSRYREERAKGQEKLAAIGRAGATANRAVFFSGMTVVLALTGMLIVPTTIFRSLAGGAITVVVVSVLASMTLLPALLSVLGDKVNSLRVFRRRREVVAGEHEDGFWNAITRGVMRRPVVGLAVAAGLLIAAAMPFFFQGHADDAGRGIKTGLSGISTVPDDVGSKQAFLALAEDFSGGMTSPARVVIDGVIASPAVQAGIQELNRVLAGDPSFGPPGELVPNPQGDLAVLEVPLAGEASDIQSEAAVTAIERLRSDYVPQAFDGVGAEVLVGGETAFMKDFFDVTDRYTPIIFVFVLGLSFLLLTVVFRSIVVPIKAIIMNLLSVGAAYGLIVLVFQKGGPAFGRWIADISGFQQVEVIEAWLPLFLFSILFGLSMDYHVFLLSRIRERYDQTGDNGESVAHGLRTTAGIITGAAIIMVAVFSGFASGELVMLQQMGFGLSVAVFLDATVVRSILVPSTMKLLGDVNWYLPRWLRWLPQLDVEGHQAAALRVPGSAVVPVPVAVDDPR
ncbi:MAG: MMPL family transporter [Actinobacteria bacterium]|nr:MMPL family transporter [Actinomycetota bacterium]